MRFKFDPKKSEALRRNPARGIGFEEARAIWRGYHYLDQRSDLPEQFRVIGWVSGKLFTVIFEERRDLGGDYVHLVTLWKSTKEEIRLYEKHF
jgi:uncharacterized DUF497 family protein